MLVAIIVCVLSLGFALVVTLFIWGAADRSAKETAQRRRLLETGTRGRARLEQVRQLSAIDEGAALALELALVILATNETAELPTPLARTLRTTVPTAALSGLRPGTVIPIRCSVTEPLEVIVDLVALGFAER